MVLLAGLLERRQAALVVMAQSSAGLTAPVAVVLVAQAQAHILLAPAVNGVLAAARP